MTCYIVLIFVKSSVNIVNKSQNKAIETKMAEIDVRTDDKYHNSPTPLNGKADSLDRIGFEEEVC